MVLEYPKLLDLLLQKDCSVISFYYKSVYASHKFDKISQGWSLGHLLISFLSKSYIRALQFRSPIVPLSSMLLLGWPIKLHLKCPIIFLVQTPILSHILPNKNMVRPITAIPQSLVPKSVLVKVTLLCRDTRTNQFL